MVEWLVSCAGILAQAAPKQQPQAPASDPGGGLTTMLLMLLPIFVLYYVIIARPQAKQERVRRQMLGALKKNDRVMTHGGIYGTVTSIDGDGEKVVLRVDDDKGVKIIVSKSYIARVLNGSDKEKEQGKPAVGTPADAS